MDVLTTTRLTKRFGALVAVDGISISVAPAHMFGLLGSNGAGKTTAIKMLTSHEESGLSRRGCVQERFARKA
jgi:ABC-type multidrug transport system ATPase subunit